MSELPKGWAAAMIGDVANLSSGYGFPKKFQGKTSGEIPFAKVRDISYAVQNLGGELDGAAHWVDGEDLSEIRAKPVPAGSVVFAKIGEAVRLNRRALLKQATIVDNNCMALSPTSAISDPRFLLKFMNTVDLAPFAVATTVPSVRRGDVESIPLNLPPLPEQRRIVAKLDRLSARSAAARDHLAHTTKLATRAKQAILIECLSGDWPSVSLSDIAKVGTGATPKKGTSRFYDGGTIPWITSGAVNQFNINATEQFITPSAIAETNCKIYPSGTLLMAMYGEGKTRGKVARLDIEAATNQALAAIQINDDAPVRDDWVIWLLHSQYLQLRELASGGVQPNLNLGMVKAIKVPTPPIEEQDARLKKIRTAFARIDRLTEEATRAAHLVDRLDERLLAKAFAGELVPQDPNNEPAEALLSRIRAARAATPKPTRGRKKKAAAE